MTPMVRRRGGQVGEAKANVLGERQEQQVEQAQRRPDQQILHGM